MQKYYLQTVQINQDVSADALIANTKSTDSAEWAAQFSTAQYPWPELPRPSFIKELPVWNQELIRRARVGSTNAKLSVWDRKAKRWVSSNEAEKKAAPLKSLHLNNLEAADDNKELTNGDAGSPKSAAESGDDSEGSEKSADEDDDGEEAVPFQPSISTSKRRKLNSRLGGGDEARIMEVKRWTQLPANEAEKALDRTFLAPRRPGMLPLYNPEYAQKIFGRYHSSSVISGTASYDLGEGGGLNNASGVLAAGTDNTQTGASTPRKNIPPRRKKKKLGGPGRKKANPNPVPSIQAPITDDGTMVANTTGAGDTAAAAGLGSAPNDTTNVGSQEADDNDESEAEGSEEGEIDETGGASKDEGAPVVDETSGIPKVDIPITVSMTSPDETAHLAGPPTLPPGLTEPLPGPPPQTNPLTGAMEVTIPGLGDILNPEEEQTTTENAQAISSTEEPVKEEVAGVFDAIKDAMQTSATKNGQEKIAHVEEKAEQREMDLLGAMDAAIDRDISEGA